MMSKDIINSSIYSQISRVRENIAGTFQAKGVS